MSGKSRAVEMLIQHNVPRSVCHSFTVLSVFNKGLGLSQQAMHRQWHFRECGYTPYACCGISFLTTTTVNTLHFSKPIRKATKKSRRILEKLRIFVYNIFCIIVSVRKERRMKGYLSIRETSYKWGISERRVNQYVAQGCIPGAERFGRSWAIPEDAKKPSDPRKADANRMSRR